MKRMMLPAMIAMLALGGCNFNPAEYAERLCRNNIRERLIDPTGARFTHPLSSYTGGNRYTASWMVTSRNRMGGMSRHRWSCSVVYEGEPNLFYAPHTVTVFGS